MNNLSIYQPDVLKLLCRFLKKYEFDIIIKNTEVRIHKSEDYNRAILNSVF